MQSLPITADPVSYDRGHETLRADISAAVTVSHQSVSMHAYVERQRGLDLSELVLDIIMLFLYLFQYRTCMRANKK